MTDLMEEGRKAYENGEPCEPNPWLSHKAKQEWEDGWMDAAAFDPDNNDVTPSDAGHPDWERDDGSYTRTDG